MPIAKMSMYFHVPHMTYPAENPFPLGGILISLNPISPPVINWKSTIYFEDSPSKKPPFSSRIVYCQPCLRTHEGIIGFSKYIPIISHDIPIDGEIPLKPIDV